MFGQLLQVPVYRTSHQIGHILAALYSADALSLLRLPFLAFHVSGGTTDCVRCLPDAGELLRTIPEAASLDLKAGQLIDRVGVMLGLSFPCGASLEQLAMQSVNTYCYKPTMKGADCCLSGLENQCAKALADGWNPCDIAKFCLTAVSEVLLEMTRRVLAEGGICPVVYAGGVMSDRIIQDRLRSVPDAVFAQPQFSCDNAVGTAVYAAICAERTA
jgi:N6-L-threonylcarbamoyladenine synthase